MGATYPAWLINTGIIWPLFATGLGVVGWFLRREYRRFKAEIKVWLQPIQPNTNGGKSLSDLHKKVDLVIDSNRVLRNDLQEHIRAVRAHEQQP